jgi:hypothetical protein
VRLLVSLTMVAALLLGPASAAGNHPGDARLPDLGMAHLRHFSIEKRPNGVRWLRFSAIIVNVGAGPFRAHGYARDADGELKVDQVIRTRSRTWVRHETAAKMYFGGDGHNHWHVRDLEQYVLEGTKTGRLYGEKHGFCFYDNFRYKVKALGGPSSPIYTSANSCNTRKNGTVRMGLSKGWGDIYPSTIVDQYIDITGLPAGEYTVTATADWANWFIESNESNNSTTARIRISKADVTVLDRGVGP